MVSVMFWASVLLCRNAQAVPLHSQAGTLSAAVRCLCGTHGPWIQSNLSNEPGQRSMLLQSYFHSTYLLASSKSREHGIDPQSVQSVTLLSIGLILQSPVYHHAVDCHMTGLLFIQELNSSYQNRDTK